MLKLFNTKTHKKEIFHPLYGNHVGLYTCGPTVYNYAHIGNLRTYVFEDILRRTLKYHKYNITHVMNITDVGHLTDDADAGEDKIEKGAKREGKSAQDIAKFYTEAFIHNIQDLNILNPTIWCNASDNIKEQIDLVQTLINKGHTYKTKDGIYFDTTTFPTYGDMAGLKNQELKAGARVDVGEKKHLHDFALWKFTAPGTTRQMEWEAFGCRGFPGWHVECSAMSMKYLGEQFDIHCGGIDHVPIHHTNEIAQSEAVTGKHPSVNFWMHGEFLIIDNDKMAKSGNNFITLQTLKDNGFSPLAYRYFLLQTHYRKQLTFSFEALDAAQNGLHRLREKIHNIPKDQQGDPHLLHQFENVIDDDLNTPEALAILWTGLKDGLVNLEIIIECDKILGLNLHETTNVNIDIPKHVQELLKQRKCARDEKDWITSDRLRDEIATLGFLVEDKNNGQEVKNYKHKK